MGIKFNLDKESLHAYVQGKLQKLDRNVQDILSRQGDQAVIIARRDGDYTDRTRNLRNSIGYIVFKDGKQVTIGEFSSTKGGQVGLAKAEEIAAKFPSGYALVIVAGMQYAAAVESRDFEVLSITAFNTKRKLALAINALVA
jgi:hypothetical protein